MAEAEKIVNDAKLKTKDMVDSSKDKLEKESDKLKSAIKAGVETYKTERES